VARGPGWCKNQVTPRQTANHHDLRKNGKASSQIKGNPGTRNCRSAPRRYSRTNGCQKKRGSAAPAKQGRWEQVTLLSAPVGGHITLEGRGVGGGSLKGQKRGQNKHASPPGKAGSGGSDLRLGEESQNSTRATMTGERRRRAGSIRNPPPKNREKERQKKKEVVGGEPEKKEGTKKPLVGRSVQGGATERLDENRKRSVAMSEHKHRGLVTCAMNFVD